METERYDVEALADHLGLDRFHLLGVSEGGTVAADYAAVHPDRVDKLVLYSCTAYGAGLAPEAFRKSFVDIIRASWGVGSKVMTDMLIPDADSTQQAEFARWQRESASAEVAASTMEMLYGWDIRPELPSITAPTLIIHRSRNRAFPPENGRALAAGIPNSRAVIIEGTVHLPPQPDDRHTVDVVNAILGFVADGATAKTPVRSASVLTIVFTDIVGSTDLVERYGDEPARRAFREHDEILKAAVTSHGGTVVKWTGDGLMATFTSVSGALDASIAMQDGLTMRALRADIPDPHSDRDPRGRTDRGGRRPVRDVDHQILAHHGRCTGRSDPRLEHRQRPGRRQGIHVDEQRAPRTPWHPRPDPHLRTRLGRQRTSSHRHLIRNGHSRSHCRRVR
jgi:class 3 adenylate cyclase